MSTNDMDDDDDICPVCESECTCANRSRHSTQAYHSGYAPLVTSRTADGCAPTHTSHPSLKIKLTLPPRPQPQPSHAGGSSSKPAGMRSSASKKKSKSHAETTSAGGSVGGDVSLIGPPFSTFGQPLTRDAQLNAHGPVPKKRGRPTKAVVAAREAAKVATASAGGRFADAGTDLSIIGNVGVARPIPKQSAACRAAPPKSGNAKKKGKKLHGAAAASREKAQQRKAQQQQQQQQQQQPQKKKREPVVEDYESSELSELNDGDEDDERDDVHSIGLPTFISAFSSSSNSSSSDSDSDTDKDERFSHSQRTDALLTGDSDYQHKRGHHNWEIYVRKRSVGVDGSSDADMDADSDEVEDAEEEAEEEEEDDEPDEDINGPGVQRLMRYAGIATGWTDDEESSFDADLFFANLSDSTAEGSDDDQMGDAKEGLGEDDSRESDEMDVTDGGLNSSGFDVMRLSEVAASGFLAPFADLERSVSVVENLPFGQGWDNLLLSNNLKDGILDFDISQLNRDALLGSALDFPIGFEDADAMMATSEEEEAVAVFDNDDTQDPDEEDGLEIFESSDGGDTTEDEYVDVDGIATPRNMVLLRFPASLGAVDPMSTVSSPARVSAERGRTLSSFLSGNRDHSRTSFKPADILSGKAFLVENKTNVDIRFENTTTSGTSSAPAMGSFAPLPTNSTKIVVITGSDHTSSGGPIPCPFPAIRRLRRRADSLNKLSRSGSDRGTSRPSSLLSAARSAFEAMASGDLESTNDTDCPPAEPIKLDDVLDTAFLDLEPSDNPIPDSTASETGESDCEHDRHLQNLRRWDRIPIDAFRKTRAAGGVSDLSLDVDKLVVVPPTPRAPRPADGFSYGSSVGGMLRGSPLSPALWESGGGAGEQPEARRGVARENRAGRMASVLISPILLPVCDGDRTPTDERHQHQQHQQHQQHAYLGFEDQHAAHAHAQNIKSRKELRKEKKRSRKFFGPAASSIRHHHFPNAKGRSSGSMQRSNFGSSIPSLSI